MHQTLGPKGPHVESHPPPKLYKSYFCCKADSVAQLLLLMHTAAAPLLLLLHRYSCKGLLLLLQSYYLHS